MSSRQTGARYTNHNSGGGGYQLRDPNNPGLLAGITGQDKISGGVKLNPATGKYEYTPEEGSSGIFGGQSRRLAATMRQQGGGQMMDIQSEKEMETMKNDHAASMAKLQQEFATKLASQKNIQDIAAKYGVTPEQYAKGIADQVTANVLQRGKLEGNSLAKPGAQQATDMGVNLAQAGMTPKDVSGDASQGGIHAMPSVPGVNLTSLTGATPNQETSVISGIGGFPMPVTRQSFNPAGIRVPVNPLAYDQAAKLQAPDANNPTPINASGGINPMPFGAPSPLANPGMSAGPFSGASGLQAVPGVPNASPMGMGQMPPPQAGGQNSMFSKILSSISMGSGPAMGQSNEDVFAQQRKQLLLQMLQESQNKIPIDNTNPMDTPRDNNTNFQLADPSAGQYPWQR